MSKDKLLEIYRRTINRIDDFSEYRILSSDVEAARKQLREILATMNQDISAIASETRAIEQICVVCGEPISCPCGAGIGT